MNDVAIADETQRRWSDGDAREYLSDNCRDTKTFLQLRAELRGNQNHEQVEQHIRDRKRGARTFRSEKYRHPIRLCPLNNV